MTTVVKPTHPRNIGVVCWTKPALMFRMPRSCNEGVPESVNVFWLKFNQLGSGRPDHWASHWPQPTAEWEWIEGNKSWSGKCQKPLILHFRFNKDMFQPDFHTGHMENHVWVSLKTMDRKAIHQNVWGPSPWPGSDAQINILKETPILMIHLCIYHYLPICLSIYLFIYLI